MTRTGNTGAALTVNYTVGRTATSAADYTALSGSVSIPIGSATATITVAAVDDSLAEGPETVIATLAAGGYTIKNPLTATVTINDNDNAGFTGRDLGPHVGGRGTATFTIKLTSQPLADVTVSVASSVSTEGTASPSTLTFTSGNWNTTQTVTVTGQNDTVTDGAVGYQINLGPAGSTDPVYNGKLIAPVLLTNTDNEPEVTITATTPAASEPSTNGVFTVTRTGSTAGSLVVNYTVGGTANAGADYTALSGSVTIPNGASSAIITVAVIDYALAEGPETVIVTLTPNAPVYTVKSPTRRR